MATALPPKHRVATPPGHPERGTVLVMALALSFVIGTLLVGTLTTTLLQAKTMRHSLDMTFAQGIAEGATELAQFQMVTEAANFSNPQTTGVAVVAGRTVPWSATTLGSPITRYASDGVQTIGQPYEINAVWTEGVATARISRVIELAMTPIFQNSIFYNGTAQISPDPVTTVVGRVHVNGDLYVDTPTTMDFDTDYLHATGEIIRGRLNDTTRSGTVSIRESQGTNYVELTETADSTSTSWVQSALASWGGGVKSGDHGVEAIGVPGRGALEPGGYYETNAGIRIVNSQAYDSNGLLISLPSGVITEKSFWDEREQANITVTEIDIAQLASSGFYPTNGLIYARRTDATTTTPNGIRLTNGSTLPSGLTVATENPIYIKGDYNTVSKKPASVMADSVNLLSNSWSDGARSSTGAIVVDDDDDDDPVKLPNGIPLATSTSFNVSMLTGEVLEGGVGSGGFEQVARLHEDWTGRSLNMLGSFAVLFESAFATAPWRDTGVAVAPARNWTFDTDLLNPALLPPYTPNGAMLRRIFWDDHEPISFKVEDSRLNLYPSAPTYDPWTYDGDFMSKVIDDPNAKLEYHKKMDYSDKVEADAPDTADRSTQTQAEQDDANTAAGRAAAIADAATAATNSMDALSSTLQDIADGNLVSAGTNAAKAAYHAHKAQEAYDQSGGDPAAQESLRKARKAEREATNALDEAVKAAADALLKP